ncbi:rhomboid-domain-containing protein [Basidiobolus meristosporus CBS 931.73]|uniref:Rhomboid-domain-containing protein n=1 Tax=Basidiobolus meristosporus CBS 931.73 TaxID=1314790 RepID=A0A1Y1XZ81_9FUNG|nr:rhomboid-domain-containing protein [Basidiobolus meristosporus CBS 931.73]|eukprot:ORX90955.1 rhomboid-domain-containing protein [Basidiobolus meristosporus CBS 931.73]
MRQSPSRHTIFSQSRLLRSKTSPPHKPIPSQKAPLTNHNPQTPSIPTVFEEVNPFQQYNQRKILQPIAFCAFTSTLAFGVSTIIYEQRHKSFWQQVFDWKERNGAFPQLGDKVEEYRQRYRQKLREVADWEMPLAFKRIYIIAWDKWNTLSDSQRTLSVLVGINTVVFGMWQIPRLAPFMSKWFLHHPLSGRSITLLTSTFSHQEFWHFGFNMFALYSFGEVCMRILGPEQFVAFYLSTGLGASLVSHLVSAGFKATVFPSLGASGAIYGCLSACAYQFPQASVFLIFLPFLPIKIGYALPAMMSFDLLGILRGWSTFDHYAHLGGAGFGLLYMKYGEKYVWDNMQKAWKEYRNQF